MARKLVLGLGLAVTVGLGVVGCDTKSSPQTATKPGGARPDSGRPGVGDTPGDADAGDKGTKDAPKATGK